MLCLAAPKAAAPGPPPRHPCPPLEHANRRRKAPPSSGHHPHWTYDEAKSSLSVAFVAAPAGPNGWVAWALNPTGEGMAGAQALVALKGSSSAPAVKTYNITGYVPLGHGSPQRIPLARVPQSRVQPLPAGGETGPAAAGSARALLDGAHRRRQRRRWEGLRWWLPGWPGFAPPPVSPRGGSDAGAGLFS
ncbi:hypothetical protein QYE76_032535 [Lolium multiflorum]|uniref:DOMON domain-containing protein n=1 Tax=Lolium multiflorum TaxID=4521 RepID=A0AAD8QVY0_LOLMU|nr:hypothetical protein QYE76_032535 [Lolium multiflorum]